jgi:thiosulfate/3-mercaptopyruvate sulfurtransferase
MRKVSRKITIFLAMVMLVSTFAGCNTHQYAETEESLIVSAEELKGYIGKENVVIVDMQSADGYAAGHVEGAVNIQNGDITINVPVNTMLTSAKKMESLMGSKGISNDTLVIAYDTNKMSASRLLWSLFMYGHENVKVVDGGLDAIKAAGITLTTDVPTVTEATFTAKEPSQNWLATKKDVLAQVNNPNANVILLDVRSDAEYYEEGKIPTSIMREYINNFYSVDGTFKSVQTTKIDYLELGIYPEHEIIIFCKSSMRACPVFVQLYEAGYRNIRIYDGAFLEWSSDSTNPIEMPEGTKAPEKNDAS